MAGDGADFKVPQQMQAGVQQVHTKVVHDAPAGQLLLRKPGADAGNATAAQPETTRVEHFAQIALVSHLLGRQQPLEGAEIEKLVVARNKYQGVKSAAPMPVYACADTDTRRRSKSQSKSELPNAIVSLLRS